ncbi:MAG: hypothetical protein ACLQBD_01965 [Syntrophobacteraceae bacterium]
MAQYKLLGPAYINGMLRLANEVVEVPDDVIPGPHMEPVDEAAKQMAARVGLVNSTNDDCRKYI